MGIFVCPKPEPRLQGFALPLKEPTQTVIKSPSASSSLNLHSPQPSSINSTFCSSFPCRDIIFSALICFPQHKVIPPSSFILLMGCFLTWTRRSPLLTAHPLSHPVPCPPGSSRSRPCLHWTPDGPHNLLRMDLHYIPLRLWALAPSLKVWECCFSRRRKKKKDNFST